MTANKATPEELVEQTIAAYKEHYDFPWQGESHMRDCLADLIESLQKQQDEG